MTRLTLFAAGVLLGALIMPYVLEYFTASTIGSTANTTAYWENVKFAARYKPRTERM
jgi:hypothetical protein